MRRALAVVLSVGLVVGLGCGQPGGDAEQEVAIDTKVAEDTAVAAAGKWLHLVDQGQYAESWDGTAAFFQQAVPQAQSRNMMESVRVPLGNGKSAIETITPHLEKDGTWRVSGYFVK